MTSRSRQNRYLGIVSLILLVACSKQVVVLPTEAPVPTVVSQTAVPTSTFTHLVVTPSPLPTESIVPYITPDAVQVERWQEYEDALARVIFSYLPPEKVVCEWVILGRANLDVYVSAYCASIYSAGPGQATIPAVIHLNLDGSVQNAEIPGSGSSYGPDIRRLFPEELQEQIFNHSTYSEILWERMRDRMRWRRGHPDEPPLIVFSTLGIQPTQPVIPWVTPEPVQIEKWKEYQTALAGEFDYRPAEVVICEWEFLGRSGNEVYLWAVCGGIGGNRVGLDGLVRIDVVDEIVVNVLHSDDPQLYPASVLERYYGGLIHFQELVDHLRWRQQGRSEEPPLIALGATPMP